MEFLKNLDKDFILDGSYKIWQLSELGIKLGDLKVKISFLDLEGIDLKISDIVDINQQVDLIFESLQKKFRKDIEKTKKITQKCIDAWETTPENFKFQEKNFRDEKIYLNTKLLSNNEYMHSAFIYFGKISIHLISGFSTGWGSNTYYEKSFYVDRLNTIDKLLEHELKKFDSKMKIRIKNSLLGLKIELSIEEAIKYLKIPGQLKETIKKEKPAFPLIFDGGKLSNILSHMGDDHVFIDEEFIDFIFEEEEIDISALNSWELQTETEGYHHHDGDTCEYTVTFTSPEGVEYCAYDAHSLIEGWSFNGEVVFK